MANFKIAHNNYLSCCAADGARWMSADFKAAQKIVAAGEGGYANDPADTGGETYKGISRKYHPQWLGWKIVDEYKMKHGALKNNAMIPNANLDAEVEKYYKMIFWNFIGGDDIKSQENANIIYDAYVNQTGWTRKMLEDALAKNGQKISVRIPLKTDVITAINSVPPSRFYNDFKFERKKRYEQRAKEVPGQQKFLLGWMNRLSKFDNQLLETVKKNYGKTILIALGIGLLVTGIYYYKKS